MNRRSIKLQANTLILTKHWLYNPHRKSLLLTKDEMKLTSRNHHVFETAEASTDPLMQYEPHFYWIDENQQRKRIRFMLKTSSGSMKDIMFTYRYKFHSDPFKVSVESNTLQILTDFAINHTTAMIKAPKHGPLFDSSMSKYRPQCIEMVEDYVMRIHASVAPGGNKKPEMIMLIPQDILERIMATKDLLLLSKF
jgi:hypothetical protein